jgi:hypothetical protein
MLAVGLWDAAPSTSFPCGTPVENYTSCSSLVRRAPSEHGLDAAADADADAAAASRREDRRDLPITGLCLHSLDNDYIPRIGVILPLACQPGSAWNEDLGRCDPDTVPVDSGGGVPLTMAAAAAAALGTCAAALVTMAQVASAQ